MKVTDHIEQANKTLFSFEVLPPLKGKGIESLYNSIDRLMEFQPSFIDVTYHREEYIMKQRRDGNYEKISLRKRPGTVAICAAIMNRYDVDAIPHLICGGFSKDETENALIDLNFLGIDNVLALRGDNQKGERHFEPEPKGNKNSLELIQQIENMNSGIYLDKEQENNIPTNFCVGVAGYPEKHIDAPNLKTDLNFLKRKVEAGSSFITTQMFFDNQNYFEYVKKVRSLGLDLAVIPGIKPLTSKNQIYTLPKIFNIDLPEDLVNEVEKAKDDAAAKQIGIEWCVAQCKELQSAGAPVLHFYTMSLSKTTSIIAKKLF
jgi:methylenetetrahydrofolate reductase (NADPH)